MNNLKKIRELYGATQEQVAVAINVNRVTVANWESGNSTVSSSNQEKLSMYYGLSPEFFYQRELDEKAKRILVDGGKEAREIAKESKGESVKEEDFHNFFKEITFDEAVSRYVFSMKVLLSTAESVDLEKLKIALQINKKMSLRLENIVKLREEEEQKEEPSLFDLLKEIETK